MATEVPLDNKILGPQDLPVDATDDQRWAAWVREYGHEFGATTLRARDILHLDLPMLTFNARMSGIDSLAATHLDVAREGEDIKVCTHYTDKQGRHKEYKPNMKIQEKLIPHYIHLPGWDGEAVRYAKTFDELPINAQKYLSFIQRRTGYPIAVATTGPEREQIVTFPGYDFSTN